MKLITIKEVSEMLGVKDKTLYQWVELGQIPSIKLNGSVRFDPDEILTWINQCKNAPKSTYNISTQARGPKNGGGF